MGLVPSPPVLVILMSSLVTSDLRLSVPWSCRLVESQASPALCPLGFSFVESRLLGIFCGFTWDCSRGGTRSEDKGITLTKIRSEDYFDNCCLVGRIISN